MGPFFTAIQLVGRRLLGSCDGLRLSLVHLLNDPLPHRVRVPHQHPYVTMTANRSDLRRCQTHLEEAADSLVA
jgi:hypothetical protein